MHFRGVWLVLLLGALSVTVVVAADRPAPTEPVFVVGEVSLNFTEITEEMDRRRRNMGVATTPSPEQLQEFITELWKIKAMAGDAIAAGLDKRADVRVDLESARRNVLVNALLNEERKRVLAAAPDFTQAARDYWESHADEYQVEEKVMASHILLKFECDCDKCDCVAERETKRKKAQEIRELLRQGQQFEVLAVQYSEDKASASKGGAMRVPLERKKLVPAFADAVFAMQPGEVSEPVLTKYGYHIIRLDLKIPQSILPFEAVANKLIEKEKDKYIIGKLRDFSETYTARAVLGVVNEEAVGLLLGPPTGENTEAKAEGRRDKVE